MGIDRVDGGEGCYEGVGKRKAGVGEVVREGCADDSALAVFEDLERHAEHVRIGAEVDAARRDGEGVGKDGEDAVLARHVVRAGRQRAGWRTAEDGGGAGQVDERVDVGEAAGEAIRRRVGVES